MSARRRYAGSFVAVLLIATLTSVGLSTGQSHRPPAESRSHGAGDAPRHIIVRELSELRTRTSNTYETASGARVAELFTSPVNYRDGGTWRRIDNALEPVGDGTVQNRANRFTAELPRDLNGPVKLSHGAAWLSFRLRGAEGIREVTSASATFQGAMPGVDVEYDVLADALKETLVLSDRESPREFVFDIDSSPGLSIVSAEGGLAVQERDGDLRFVVPAPVVWDARTADNAAADPVSLTYDAAKQQATLRVDDAYVEDPVRRFPIKVDPYVALPAQPKDCHLSALAAEHNVSFCGVDYLHLGTIDGHDHHALLDFDAGESIPRNSTILEAFVATWLRSQHGTTWTDWAMHAVTRPWVDQQASWARASTATAWTTPGGDYNPTAAHIKTSGGGWANAWAYWPIGDQVQRWADGVEPDHGLLIKPTIPNPPNGYVLASGNDPDASKWPKLTILYQPAAGDEGPFSSVYEWVDDTRLGVNVASGWPTVYDRDAIASPVEPGANLERYYNGTDTRTTPLGKRWKLANSTLNVMGNLDVVIELPSGTWVRFPRRSDGTYGPADRIGEEAQLTFVNNEYRLELPERDERFIYDSAKRLVRREWTAGTTSVRYGYDAQGRLSTITDAANAVTQLTYNTSGRVSSAALPGNRTVTYVYTGDKLTSRTSAGATTSYQYDATGRLNRIQAPGGRVDIVYDAQNRVTAFTRVTDPVAGTGPTTRFAYFDRTQLASCPPESFGRTVETRPDNSTITYCYDARLEMIEMTTSSSTAESPALQDLAVAGYAAEYNVSVATAQTALSRQDRSVGLGEDITNSAAKPGYAGVWFNNTDRRVKVGLTHGTDATPVNQAIAARGLSTEADIVRVAHTEGKLILERDRILDQVPDLVNAALISGAFRVDRNDVLIRIGTATTAEQRSRVNAAVAGATVPVAVTVGPEPNFDVFELACERRYCDPPMRGGVALRESKPTQSFPRCTAAFIVREQVRPGRPDRLPFVLTAGHCVGGWLQETDNRIGVARGGDETGDEPLNFLGFPVGAPSHLAPSQDGSGDFGLVSIRDESLYRTNLVPWVIVSEAKDKQGDPRNNFRTRRDLSYRINRVDRNRKGTTVCLSGRRSGTKCGEVDELGASVSGRRTYFARVKLYNCKDSDPISRKLAEGDSGAPVFKNHTAFGILSSIPKEKGRASCVLYYSGAREAENRMRIDILPEGGLENP